MYRESKTFALYIDGNNCGEPKVYFDHIVLGLNKLIDIKKTNHKRYFYKIRKYSPMIYALLELLKLDTRY